MTYKLNYTRLLMLLKRQPKGWIWYKPSKEFHLDNCYVIAVMISLGYLGVRNNTDLRITRKGRKLLK